MAEKKTKTKAIATAGLTAKAAEKAPAKRKAVSKKPAKAASVGGTTKAAAKASVSKPKARAKATSTRTAASGAAPRRAALKKTTTPKKPAKQRPSIDPAALHEEISLLAYHLWEQRGRPHDSSAEDWSRAERQILETAGR